MAEKYQSRKTKKESHLKDISVHCRIFRVFFFERQKSSQGSYYSINDGPAFLLTQVDHKSSKDELWPRRGTGKLEHVERRPWSEVSARSCMPGRRYALLCGGGWILEMTVLENFFFSFALKPVIFQPNILWRSADLRKAYVRC